MAVPSIFVVGGNGFLGSAICKAAVARGWEVSSMSSSGKPYTSPAGHMPKWANSVHWHKGSAFDPSTYSDLAQSSSAVVHTLGILLEDTGYKDAVRRSDFFGVAKAFTASLTGGNGNPLKSKAEKQKSYEGMNRDSGEHMGHTSRSYFDQLTLSALTVLDAMLSASPTHATSEAAEGSNRPRKPFVYISAADGFRPVVPARYIETKREAESEILRRCLSGEGASVRPVFMRPGLMYHPHIRPLSTLPAFGLSLTAGLHDRLNMPLPFGANSVLGGAAAALRTHPLHVDHVAEAVVRCIAEEDKQGIIDVPTMRQWAGFKTAGQAEHANPLQS